jgi:AcrR family transcriptional regulator
MTKADHRPVVAAQRRERMRRRLIEAALAVLAERGVEGTVIEDVIARAEVSRGTFYNHFPDLLNLMVAVRDDCLDELLQVSLAAVADIDDPAEACAKGMQVALGVTAAHPLLARFSVHLGFRLWEEGTLMGRLLPPLFAKGVAVGRFCPMPVDIAADSLTGLMQVAVRRQAMGQPFDVAAVIAGMLRLLAVPADEAERLAHLSVPILSLPPEGLLARSLGK